MVSLKKADTGKIKLSQLVHVQIGTLMRRTRDGQVQQTGQDTASTFWLMISGVPSGARVAKSDVNALWDGAPVQGQQTGFIELNERAAGRQH